AEHAAQIPRRGARPRFSQRARLPAARASGGGRRRWREGQTTHGSCSVPFAQRNLCCPLDDEEKFPRQGLCGGCVLRGHLTALSSRTHGLCAANLGGMASTKEGFEEVEKLLAETPPWRAQFFQAIAGAVTDARIPLTMFLGIKDTAAPPSASE